MKGKLLNIAISTFVCLAMVLGLVAALAPAVAVAESYGTPGIDVIASIDEPNQGRYNVALETDIVALAQGADGTLFAGVYDQSGERWDITVSGVDYERCYAVFYSETGTANGYDWKQGFIVPWDDNTSIVEIVPVPGYTQPGTVYMATETYVYVSLDGAKTFTRLDPVPGVLTPLDGDCITSIDVAKNIQTCVTCDPSYAVVVGTLGSTSSGVYVYNEGGFAWWVDKQIGNGPATVNNFDVYDVKFNPRYFDDKEKVIVALALNTSSYTILTVRGVMGTWGVEVLDATICALAVDGGNIDFADDYHWLNSPRSFVGIYDGNVNGNAYRVISIQSPGAPSVKNLLVAGGTSVTPVPWDVFDIAVTGTGSNLTGLVAVESTTDTGQLQVLRSTTVAGFSCCWQESHKPPIGGPTTEYGCNTMCYDNNAVASLISTSHGAYIGSGDGNSTSGVSKLVEGSAGMAWNGIGMVDTIVTSGDYLQSYYDYVAGAVWTEVSPSFAGDKTIFLITNDYDYAAAGSSYGDIYVWRTINCGDTWELILMSELDMPVCTVTADDWDWVSEEVIDPDSNWMDGYMWSLRTAPDFTSAAGGNQVLFLQGYHEDKALEWLFKSTDAGNTWSPIIAMPTYTDYLSNTAFQVVDNNTILMADYYGYIYKTTNNGYSWTYGQPTAYDCDVTDLDYYIDPTLGLVVLVGLFDSSSDDACEVWISLDGGYWFEPVGTSLTYTNYYGSFGLTMVGFDQNFKDNRTIYGAAGGQLDQWYYTDAESRWERYEYYDCGLWRAEVKLESPDTSLWDEIVTTEDVSASMPAWDMTRDDDWDSDGERYWWPTDLEVGADNTIYVPFVFFDEFYYGRNTYGGFIRCLDGTEYPEEWVFVDDGMPRYGGLWLGSVAPGSTYLFSIGYRYDYWDNDLIDLRLLAYKDTLSGAGPAAAGPLDGATGVGVLASDTSCNVPLSWAAKGGATKYAWEVSEDEAFTNPISGTTSGTTVTVLDLKPATDYYWRSRSIEPGVGRWSTPQQFTTIPGGETGAPEASTPENGATITDTTPLFTWDKVPNATNYNLQVATDPGFGAADIVIDEELGDVSAYEADKELVNGTYYWRVQGTNPATDSDSPWSFGSFTLDTEADGGAGTPVWVWVLIVLGVVLGIVVLVLILRTRRPV